MTAHRTDLDDLPLLTWQQFLDLDYETRNTDLIDGRMYVNSPGPVHEHVLGRLIVLFDRWAGAVDGGTPTGEMSTQPPIGIAVNRGYMPDLAWWPESQCSVDDGLLAFEGLPSIVLEVLSPSTRAFDLVRKRNDYERIGIAEFWVVDPKSRTAILHRRSEPGSATYDEVTEINAEGDISSPLLLGFTAPIAALFRRR